MSQHKTRILIVEDEPAHAQVLKRNLLATDTFTVELATSIAEYLQSISVLSPDLLLLDLNLPDGSAIDYLKKNQDRPYPVLIMTAQGNEELAVAALKAGALDYIVKSPESFTTIPRIVKRSLREWRIKQDHHNALVALQESELRFRTLLEDVSSVAVQGYQTDGTIFYWNRASEKLYGYSKAEALGKNLIDLIVPAEMKDEVRHAFKSMNIS